MHCPNCWEDLSKCRIRKDYKGNRYIICPNCGERIDFTD